MLLGVKLHNRANRVYRDVRTEQALLGHIMRSRHRWRRVAYAHRPTGQPCAIVWCLHSCLSKLGGGPSFEHCLLVGLATRFVWGLGGNIMRLLGPQILCGGFRALYRYIDAGKSMGTVPIADSVSMYL